MTPLTLITDRTATDVADARRLLAKLRDGKPLTEAERAAYLAGLRGCYNASDMNRVGEAVRDIADRLIAAGYAPRVSPKTDWAMTDIVRQSDWSHYLDDVRELRRKLAMLPTTPSITDAMYSGIDHAGANDIERILVDLDFLITNMMKSYVYVGEVFAGEI